METQTRKLPQLYLSSGSPRRQALLQQLNLEFKVLKAPIDEIKSTEESPEQYVLRIAAEKAVEGAKQVCSEQAWVVGGDTAVVLNQQVFGKPADEAEAVQMLSDLSNQTHTVLSAVVVVHKGQTFSALNQTQVTFRTVSTEEIQAYWLSGEPIGKAGSYAIQGLGAQFIKQIQGSYSGVMGLPLYELDQLLIESGYRSALRKGA